jgi:hypothetical protein
MRFAIYGGIIAALTATYIFAKKRQLKILDLLDLMAPYLALGQLLADGAILFIRKHSALLQIYHGECRFSTRVA